MKYINTLTGFLVKQKAKNRQCRIYEAKGTISIMVICPRETEADMAKAKLGYCTTIPMGLVGTYILEGGNVFESPKRLRALNFEL